MERTVSATEARVHFGELMRRIKAGEEVIIVERAGEPQIVLMSVARYQDLQSKSGGRVEWKSLLTRAEKRIIQEKGKRKLKPAADIIRQVRDERNAKFSGLR